MVISAAGPGINLAFALGFLGLLLVVGLGAGFLSIVGFFGFELNVGLGSFNMLPVPPLDGSKIFRKSIPVALGLTSSVGAVSNPLPGNILELPSLNLDYSWNSCESASLRLVD